MGIMPLSDSLRIKLGHFLERAQRVMERSQLKLASGKRVLDASDDAASLAIGETLKSQERSVRQATRNAQDAISVVQVAEGAIHETDQILIRLRELAIESATATVSEKERGFLNTEFQNLLEEITRLSKVTEFLHIFPLSDDSEKENLRFQVSTGAEEENQIFYDTTQTQISGDSLGVSGLSIEDPDEAIDTLDTLDEALTTVLTSRSYLGALQNRLHSSIHALQSQQEALSGARSVRLDVDFAQESAKLIQTQIQFQAALAVQAQAQELSKKELAFLI